MISLSPYHPIPTNSIAEAISNAFLTPAFSSRYLPENTPQPLCVASDIANGTDAAYHGTLNGSDATPPLNDAVASNLSATIPDQLPTPLDAGVPHVPVANPCPERLAPLWPVCRDINTTSQRDAFEAALEAQRGQKSSTTTPSPPCRTPGARTRTSKARTDFRRTVTGVRRGRPMCLPSTGRWWTGVEVTDN
ncbi:MAG: hypothetical protein Q9175_005656 [Cornicularia normoerica]